MKARLMTVLALSVLAALAGADDPKAAVKMPDTPAGRLLAGWLGALGTGKPEALQRFITENYSEDVLARGTAQQRAAGGIRLYQENGGAPELARIEHSSAHELVALVQFPVTESWLRVSVKVAPEPPHTVTQWTVASHRPPDPGNAKRLSDEEIAARAEAYLAKLVAADLFSGSVVVAHDGKPILCRAYGLASRAHDVPNRTDTKFNLGSMNKMFTAVAVAQLAEKGRLAFTDPVGKHLPDYPNKAVAEKVTLHHLLTHTSGVGDYFNDKYMEAAKDRFRTVRDFFPLFVDKPLEFEPGSRFRYSNAGFMILGAVIEKVSGQSYFDYVRDHVYKPAGMTDTDAYEMDQDTPNLATGYTRMNLQGQSVAGPRRNNLFLHVVKGGPAGGGFSTAEDLIRFARRSAATGCSARSRPSWSWPARWSRTPERNTPTASRRKWSTATASSATAAASSGSTPSSTSIPVWATTSPSCPTTTHPRRRTSPASSAPSSAGSEPRRYPSSSFHR